MRSQNNSQSGIEKKSKDKHPSISENDLVATAVNSISRMDYGLKLEHPNYVWNFHADYLEMRPTSASPTWSWSMDSVSATTPVYIKNRVVYDRGSVVEDYVIKSNSIEQRFIVSNPPAYPGDGIIIEGTISSSGLLSKTKNGWSWQNEFGEVTITNAIAYDAHSRSVPVCMEVSQQHTKIEIDGADLQGVAYPITIDPEIGTNDFRISTMGTDGDASFGAVDAAIAYNKSSNKYLVVWEGNVSGENEIYGQLIDGSNGSKLGGIITISDMGPGGNVNFDANDPDVASSGSEFLVVWHGDDAIDEAIEIYGQRIDASGNQVGVNDFRISDMGTSDADINFVAISAAVVYNNTQKEYLVAWAGDDDTSPLVNDEFEIYIQRLDSLGNEFGTDTKISDMGGPDGNINYGASSPDLVWDKTNNQYVVVWRGDDSIVPLVDNEFEIFLQRLSGISAGQIGSNDFRISDMGTDGLTTYGAFSPAIAYNKTNNNYLVVWHGDDDAGGVIDNENEIYGQLLTNLCAESGSDFRISDMGVDGNANYDAQNPNISYDLHLNSYLVSWQGDDNSSTLVDNEIEIFGQLLTGLGAEAGTNDFRLSDVGGTGNALYNASDVALSYNEIQREYLLIWEADDFDAGTIDGEFEIFGQRFSELKAEPGSQPGSLSITVPTSSSLTVSYPAAINAPIPEGYIVLRKSGSSPANDPVDASVYTVGDILGTGPTSDTVVFVGSALTFNQTGLTENLTYHYKVFSYSGVNSSTNYRTPSAVVTSEITSATEPSAHATTFTATTAGTNQINLAFSKASAIANADGYIILRRQDGNNPTSSGVVDRAVVPSNPVIGTTLVTSITDKEATSFQDLSVSPGIQYNYTIIPYGYNGSNVLTYNFRTAATIPTANATTLSLEPSAHASSFTATASGTSQINLSFSAANTITNAVGYIILRRQDGTNPTTAGVADATTTAGTPTTGTTLVTTITNTATTTFNDAVSPGTQYNYSIIPFGYNGSSALTYNYRTATTIPTTNATTLSLKPLAHPASFTAATGGSNQINLTFSAASTITNAVGYIILRRQDLSNPTNAGITDATTTPTTPTAGTTLITTITNTATTTFNDVTANPGIQYNYAIFAFGYNGSNALTYNYLLTTGLTANAFTLSLEPTAHAATFTATASGTSQINLSFSAASTLTNAAGYIILRRQDGANPTATGITDGASAPGTPVTGTTLVTTITNTATTSFNDAVSPGTQYHYAIIPYGYNGSNALTYNYRTATTIPTTNATTLSLEPLAHPASFTAATGGSNQINLTFSAASTISNAAGYIILRRQDGTNPTATGIVDAASAPSTPIAGTTVVTTITNTGTTSFNDTGVNPGIQYNYAIFAFGYNGSNALTFNYLLTAGLTSNAFTLSAEPATHAASFTATQSGTSQIILNFSAASTITNAAGYIILRRQDGANPTATGITDGVSTPGTPATGTTFVTITNAAATSFNDAVSSGTQYNYAIIPYGYNGSNALTYNYRTAVTIPTANASTLSLEPTSHPASLTATQVSASQINLTFSAASSITNAAGYIILRRQDGANPTATGIVDGASTPSIPVTGTTLITTVTNISSTTFNDTGLSSGVQYNYSIIPYGYNGVNSLTYNYRTVATIRTANATTVVTEPGAQPTLLTFNTVTTTTMNGAFTLAAGASNYLVLRKTGSSPTDIPTDGVGYSVGATIGSSDVVYSGNSTTFSSTALTPNTIYHYDIFSYNGSGVTANYLLTSPLEGSQTTLQTEPTAQPSGLGYSLHTTTSVRLNFTGATGAPAGYLIIRKAGSVSSGIPVDGTSYSVGGSLDGTIVAIGSSTQFDDSGLTAGTTYHYKIFSYNGTGPATNYLTSGPLANSTITLPDAPTAESLTDLDVSQTSFTARWSTVTGATVYRLDVSTDNFVTRIPGYDSRSVAINSETVTGLTASTIYQYRVRAENGIGLPSSNSNTVPVTTDAAPGGSVINITEPITCPDLESGQPSVMISVQVTNGNGSKTVELFNRKITSEGTHTSLLMSNTTGSTYTTSVPASAFDEIGVEFYVRAQDLSGTDQTGLYYCYKSFAASAAVPIPSIVRFGGTQKSYQIISIPFDLGTNNGIEDIFETVPELGGYDKTKWRLVRYQNEENVDPPTFNKIELGKSYWFNSVQQVSVPIPSGKTPKHNQSTTFEMHLVQGWNQIATPYPFNIDWDDVLSANSSSAVGNYKIFNSGELGFQESNLLKPYEGGFVFADNTVTLSIPVTLKNSAGGRKAKDELSQNIDAGKWLLPFTLVQGDVINKLGGIGMHPEANSSKDRWDDVTAPRFIQYLETNFYHSEFFWPKFSRDVVPTTEEHEWTLSIESNGHGPIELQWDAQSFTNAQSNLFLYDEAEGRLINMKVQSSIIISERSRKDLKVVFTHQGEYIPDHTKLGNAWPNPANAEVNIPVILAGTAPSYTVEVDVYDLKGVKQKSIGVGEYQAGIHTAQWDVRDEDGNDVTNGVYLVKLKVNGRYLPEYSKVIVNRNH